MMNISLIWDVKEILSLPIFTKYWLNKLAFIPSSKTSELYSSLIGPILEGFGIPVMLCTVSQNVLELFASVKFSFQYFDSADLNRAVRPSQ